MFAAIDIGASSGRVVAGLASEDALTIEVVHRFVNGMHTSDGHLRWNLSGLFAEVLVGLSVLADRYDDVVSIGIDTWAVDYGLLGGDGTLLAEPIAYRDSRTDAVISEVDGVISRKRQYKINGLQFLPFNTIYQLAAEQRGDLWPRVEHAVLLPDLLAYWLTGELRTEITNASTTGLLDARSRSWSAEAFDAISLRHDLFPPLIEPGETVGAITTEIAERTGLPASTAVVAVGSHDTASAVVAVPAADRDVAYVSSGTWSLVGVELDQPVITDDSRAANFTNEGGVDARVRFLRNVGGLWLLQESLRKWSADGLDTDLPTLLAGAAEQPAGGPVIDVDDDAFIAPDDMPARIQQACRASGQSVPRDQAAIVRCIMDSLAEAYARTVAQAEQLTGRTVRIIHVVGGGSQNDLLCRLTAERAGRPVLAGPAEATALGNVIVQARTAGAVEGVLENLRAGLRNQLALRRYEPVTGTDGP
ncbi:MAG TPA: rhamnulokinase family protein [Microlunatus sp.]|nr:rhamnulokinase family protein [Microlunatus sp.]